MLQNRGIMEEKIAEFRELTGCVFDLTIFESRAEEIERINPGQGYKMAYKEMLKGICSQLIEKANREDEVTSIIGACWHLGNLMNSYKKECDKENININIKKDFKEEVFENDGNYFQYLREAVNSNASQMGAAFDQYKSGKLKVSDMLRFTEACKKGGDPTLDDIKTIASYARAMQTVNESRSFGWKVRHLYTHLQEKWQIRSMRNYVKENCSASIEEIEKEAAKENSYTTNQRNEIIQEMKYVTHTEIKALDTEKDATNIKDLPKRIQLEINLDDELEDEMSPRVDNSQQKSRNRERE